MMDQNMIKTDQTDKIIQRLAQKKENYLEGARLQMQLWNGETPDRQPLLLSCNLDDEDNALCPDYNTKETHYDSKKMLISGLKPMLSTAYGAMEAVPSIRANMGCGIFPSLFPGIRQELFEDKMPWVQIHLPKEELVQMQTGDLRIGDEFKAGLEHMSFMADKLKDTGCSVFPMDVQGAFDVAHLVYGDAIFYDLFDDPAFVHHLMELSCHAIFMGMEACLETIPDADKTVAHYNELVIPRSKGGIKISEDTSTLLSQEQIEQFVSPYIHKILEYFGGGYVHYCGRNPHLFEAVMNEPLALGINFGNPEMHPIEDVLSRCAREGKIYYGRIPCDEHESHEQYFRRLLNASKMNDQSDRAMLLLSYQCDKHERDAVAAAWISAQSVLTDQV